MVCSEVMRRFVQWISPQESVQAAARKMRDANVGLMPVCDEGSRVIGVVTDRDLAVRACAEDLSPTRTKVSEVMTVDVIACRPGDSIEKAGASMREHHITRVLVTDEDGMLCGLVSLSDLVFYEPSARVGRTLRAIAERKYIPEGGL